MLEEVILKGYITRNFDKDKMKDVRIIGMVSDKSVRIRTESIKTKRRWRWGKHGKVNL